jgi:galactose-1-phosphate uridylyltransferase
MSNNPEWIKFNSFLVAAQLEASEVRAQCEYGELEISINLSGTVGCEFF